MKTIKLEKFHPDRNIGQEMEARDRFFEVAAAYEMIRAYRM